MLGRCFPALRWCLWRRCFIVNRQRGESSIATWSRHLGGWLGMTTLLLGALVSMSLGWTRYYTLTNDKEAVLIAPVCAVHIAPRQ
ncbi:MAG: hypothetical protein R2795_27145 [Saprospiraceae bacterium]